MNDRVYRVQDDNGRGPYKPGRSHIWTDAHHNQRNPSLFDDFSITPAELERCWHPNENGGCAFRTLDQLHSWFQLAERFRLEELGYSIVTMLADRIVLESDRQLIFARKRPLRLGAIKLPWHAEEWAG